MKYHTYDIQSPEEIASSSPNHSYIGTLGKAEYEIIAEKIIVESQKIGRWVSVRKEHLEDTLIPLNLREEHTKINISEMIKNGHLIKIEDKEGYILTNKAIEKIAEKYPSITEET